MKRHLFLLLTCLGLTTQGYTQDCCYSASCTDCFGLDSVLTYGIGGGYRQDNLKWKVYPLYNPGTVVKEEWKNIGMGIVDTNAQFLICDTYLFKFDFDYGWFNKSGKQHVTDFDFNTNSLTEDFKSRTKGRAYDLEGAVGYQFNWCCYRYALTPLVGYSYSFQKFTNRFYQNEFLPESAEFATHNDYKFRWRGPTIGLTATYQVECNWQVFFNYTFHWVRYRAKIEDIFLSNGTVNQKSNDAHGNEYTLGTSYEFCPDWLLVIKVNYKNFFSNKGKSVVRTDVGTDSSALRKLRWDSIYATMDVAYVF